MNQEGPQVLFAVHLLCWHQHLYCSMVRVRQGAVLSITNPTRYGILQPECFPDTSHWEAIWSLALVTCKHRGGTVSLWQYWIRALQNITRYYIWFCNSLHHCLGSLLFCFLACGTSRPLGYLLIRSFLAHLLPFDNSFVEGSFQGTEAVPELVRDRAKALQIRMEWSLHLLYALI